MDSKRILLLVALLAVFSQSSVAQYEAQGSLAGGILNYAIPIICGVFMGIFWLGGSLAGLVVVYSGIKYITSMEDPGARKKARETMQHAIVGLIILVVVASFVGLVTDFKLEACASG